MLNNDGMDAVGEVTLRTFKMVNGEKVYINPFEKNNLIVEVGRGVVVDLLLGLTNKKLTFIEWGRGGAPSYPEGDPLNEYNVKDTDTKLSEVLIRKKLHDHTRLSTTKVQFNETILSDEVDSPVNEAALILYDEKTAEETMFARITFPTVSLLEAHGFGIDLKWTINFREVRANECGEGGDINETTSVD